MQYNFWTVLTPNVRKTKKRTYHLCQCQCGVIKEVDEYCLRTNKSKSCGCMNATFGRKIHFIDETNNRYGYLKVLSKTEERDGNGSIYWLCECRCGAQRTVIGSHLRDGHTKSCGCINSSINENLINEYLINKKIKFRRQYTFKELIDESSLRFDFAILNSLGQVQILIEYDGQQHFQPVSIFGGEESYLKTIKHDDMKAQFCLIKNIPLYRIKFNEDIHEALSRIFLGLLP